MIRRFSAALIGLALCLPVFAAPVAAHGSTSFTVDATVLADDTIVGTVTNHTTSRRSNIVVTATYEQGTVDHTETAIALVTNLAPHSASAFRLVPVADVSGMPAPTFSATGDTTGTKPTGGLHVEPCDFSGGDSCTGSVTNDGAANAVNVQVFAARMNGSAYTDAKASNTIASLAPAATAAYTIAFDAASDGTTTSAPIAKTGVGAPVFYTSWNNYFGDLNNTSEGFVDEIGWMADEGITSGCGAAIFCPKSSVSRGEMAVFLTRALGLSNFADAGFQDIGSLNQTFKDSINAVANAGITSGCSVTPKNFCPSSSVTRGQMSVFIVKGYGLTPIAGAGIFTDDNGHFSETYNNRMAADGITSGCAATLFCPNTNVLREQMAVFLFRAENPS
jgi:S-layer homology domain